MEIRGVSSTTANRPAAFQPTETGAAPASIPAESAGTAANSETGKASGAGFISPFLRYDQGARVAVLYFRDFDTGETQDQIPSQRVVEEYRRTASRLAQEDERKSAAAQTGSNGSGNGAGASSATGYSQTASGSTASNPGPAATSIGASFASSPGSGGSTASGGAAPTTGGFTPPAAGGSYGGSPGGLVSMTV